MVESFGPTEIDRDEKQAHRDRCDDEQLAKYYGVAQFFVAVDIDGDHEHHRRRRDSGEVGEVCDVQAPRHLIGRPGCR